MCRKRSFWQGAAVEEPLTCLVQQEASELSSCLGVSSPVGVAGPEGPMAIHIGVEPSDKKLRIHGASSLGP